MLKIFDIINILIPCQVSEQHVGFWLEDRSSPFFFLSGYSIWHYKYLHIHGDDCYGCTISQLYWKLLDCHPHHKPLPDNLYLSLRLWKLRVILSHANAMILVHLCYFMMMFALLLRFFFIKTSYTSVVCQDTLYFFYHSVLFC